MVSGSLLHPCPSPLQEQSSETRPLPQSSPVRSANFPKQQSAHVPPCHHVPRSSIRTHVAPESLPTPCHLKSMVPSYLDTITWFWWSNQRSGLSALTYGYMWSLRLVLHVNTYLGIWTLYWLLAIRSLNTTKTITLSEVRTLQFLCHLIFTMIMLFPLTDERITNFLQLTGSG